MTEKQMLRQRRKSLRVAKTFDEYVIKTGSAGFVVLTKNGQRIQPKNFELTLRKRR
jgi:hypothetical protein